MRNEERHPNSRRNGRSVRADFAAGGAGFDGDHGKFACRRRRAGDAHHPTSQSLAARTSPGRTDLGPSRGTTLAFPYAGYEEADVVLNQMFASTPIPVVEQWLNFAQSRHEILATNVANIDVPGYRTRDLSVDQFQSKLKEAVASRNDHTEEAVSLSPVNVDPFAKVREGMNDILRHDDGNVGIEQQVAEITKNHMQHNLALTILNGQFRLLQAAVTERA